MLDKLTVFKEVKEIGHRWVVGNKQQREQVVKELSDLRRPKGTLYPALVHRYITKELGFEKASEFAVGLLNHVAR